jgi:hypothetical protein
MAKKPRAPRTQAASTPAPTAQRLVDAIATVKRLQEFIQEHGGLEKAFGTVVSVCQLMESTGGFEQLKESLEIVGKDTAAPQA